MNRDLCRNLPFICEYLYRAFVHEQKSLGVRNIHHLDDRRVRSANARGTRRDQLRLPMARTFRAATCLFLLFFALGGCTKCGWLWDQAPRSCHSEAPR